MKIKVDEKMYNCELKLWRDGWSAGYEPDCLNDLDISLIEKYDHELECSVMTSEDFYYFCDYWNKEIEKANREPEYEGESLHGLNKEEIQNGDEWHFICAEI